MCHDISAINHHKPIFVSLDSSTNLAIPSGNLYTIACWKIPIQFDDFAAAQTSI